MLGGSWSTGTVRGHLKEAGWGAQHGYPGLVLDPNGPEVQVHILEADALAAHWERLDAFEGSGYRRTVTQVMTRDGFVSAYIYALSEPN